MPMISQAYRMQIIVCVGHGSLARQKVDAQKLEQSTMFYHSTLTRLSCFAQAHKTIGNVLLSNGGFIVGCNPTSNGK